MANILDTVKSYLTPELIGQAAQLLGEDENGISKAAGSIAPTILAGLLQKSTNSAGMADVFGLLSKFSPDVLDNLGGLLGGGNLAKDDPKDVSGKLLGMLFGAKVPAITNAISAFSGVQNSSTSSLLGMVGPLVMGLLGKKINTEGLTPNAFNSFLQTEKSNILSALPAGLGSVLGLHFGDDTQKEAAETSSTGGTRWLWPLFILFALAAGAIYYMKNCNKAIATENQTVTVPAVDSAAIKAAQAAEAAKAAAANVYSKTLAGGFEIKGNSNGIESKLISFIEDAAKPVDKTTWFDFDHLNFKSGSADLDMAYSHEQLNNIYEVLKAFPKVAIKIGGYTDSDGDDKANQALSQKRADNVMKALIDMGVAKNRLAAEGYGEQFPVCPANDTPECKAQNRRIAVRVTAK